MSSVTTTTPDSTTETITPTKAGYHQPNLTEDTVPHVENKYEFGAYLVKNFWKLLIAAVIFLMCLAGVIIIADRTDSDVEFFGIKVHSK
jgi:hypothetical protein